MKHILNFINLVVNMNLKKFKEKNGMSLGDIKQKTGIPRSTLHRIVSDVSYMPNLKHAKVLVEWSNGEITYEDLLKG
jgi:predicted transcriptional regulator